MRKLEYKTGKTPLFIKKTKTLFINCYKILILGGKLDFFLFSTKKVIHNSHSYYFINFTNTIHT